MADFIVSEVLFDAENKTPVRFVALQICELNGKMHEIIKHDFAHGVYNVHRFFENPGNKVEFPGIPISNGLIYSSKKDIMINWKDYKARFFTRHGPNINI